MPIVHPPVLQYADAVGAPLAFAKAYFTETGTTTPVAVYQDAAFTNPHEWPVNALADGIFPPIFFDPTLGLIRCRIITELGDLNNPLIDADPVNGSVAMFYAPSFEFLGGVPTADVVLGLHTLRSNVVFPSGWGIGGFAKTTAAANYTFNVTNQAGTLLGSITFPAGTAAPTGNTSGVEVSLSDGDTLVFVDVNGGDASLSDFTWTLKGRVVT